jgi:hypothetical protein
MFKRHISLLHMGYMKFFINYFVENFYFLVGGGEKKSMVNFQRLQREDSIEERASLVLLLIKE